ncbi:hypothetical protein, partial [Lacticaseibacillus rhamnosus]|uniref:hypothetical protein n=1 Tax=Lacticaseibacillus rhamnosus TaxID=47715 RepID=UPI001CDB8171
DMQTILFNRFNNPLPVNFNCFLDATHEYLAKPAKWRGQYFFVDTASLYPLVPANVTATK